MNFKEKVNVFFNTKDFSKEFTEEDRGSHHGLAAIGYIPFLFILSLIMGKDSDYVRFHANQALLLIILDLVIVVVLGPLCWIEYVGAVFKIIKSIATVAIVIFSLIGFANALNGKAKEIPVIGGIRIIQEKKM